MSKRNSGLDVVIIGGGPAGATLGSLLAMSGYRALIVEKDIHPRDHVGEALTPSTNVIFDRIGFLPKMEEAGFVKKPGVAWTTPVSPVGTFPVTVRTAEFPFPGSKNPYSFNVERDAFDALLLRHAHELGAQVLQGVAVREVLFDGDRATGVRVSAADGWEGELRARVVVDASGRNCLLADQLRLRRKDPEFRQFTIYSRFRGVEPEPSGYEGYLFLHFLGLEQGWAWQIPLRDGVCSVGVVTDREDFRASKAGKTDAEFFDTLIRRNRTMRHIMRGAEPIRPWSIEGDYTYAVEAPYGDGWLIIGDAVRFIDPIFATGIDIATYSALFAYEAIDASFKGTNEDVAFGRFAETLGAGADAWYGLVSLFYKLQNLFTIFLVRRRYRERMIRTLQGNVFIPESLERARELIDDMQKSYERVMGDPENLLRPGALKEREYSLGNAP